MAAYNRFFDQLQGIVDSINHDSDPSQRLANLQQLYKDSVTLILRSRDEAAYDLRSRYNGENAAQLTGVHRKYIDYWATRWRMKNNLPRLKNKRTIDLSDAIDLSGGAASPPTPPLSLPGEA